MQEQKLEEQRQQDAERAKRARIVQIPNPKGGTSQIVIPQISITPKLPIPRNPVSNILKMPVPQEFISIADKDHNETLYAVMNVPKQN